VPVMTSNLESLSSIVDDEATPEHIEQMALKILGPQSEYSSVDWFYKALEGVKALLNQYCCADERKNRVLQIM